MRVIVSPLPPKKGAGNAAGKATFTIFQVLCEPGPGPPATDGRFTARHGGRFLPHAAPRQAAGALLG
ncbi:hypothetical protein AAFF_G00269150 [Aldrovandia affinis]|uniref:Uncharacterized protein n=1 Tax=Aldrovandia affinis TaxID=143900 RepID=A0AAD7SU60_9TELE|nr:hypothetical protein AAFF_G00269150 [Aldrovandia affinis]